MRVWCAVGGSWAGLTERLWIGASEKGRVARCSALNAEGKPCGSPESVVDPESGLCWAHQPGSRERLVEAGRKGAAATARKWRGRGGLEPGELPQLGTPHDAQRALDIVAHAAAEGRLPQRQADATTRAVREWLRAHEAGVVSDRLEELRATVAELKGEKKLRSVK